MAYKTHSIQENPEKVKNHVLNKCAICFEEFEDLQLLELHVFLCQSAKTVKECVNNTFIQDELAKNENDNESDDDPLDVRNLETEDTEYCIVEDKDYLSQYLCETCDKTFNDSEIFITHSVREHGFQVEEISYDCSMCNKSFKNLSLFTNHIKIMPKIENGALVQEKHHGNSSEALKKHIYKDHKCESCGKSFSGAQYLKKHMYTVHEGHKDYKCESCSKSFSQAGDLKQHIHTVHEGHKDYKCESCSKSFSDAGNLKQHIHSVHEGHKDHKCDFCSKLFAQGGQLKVHIYTIHEGHKDYKCESCSKSFTRANILKRHIRSVQEGYKDYKCESCGKSFTRSGTLKKHILKVLEGHFI